MSALGQKRTQRRDQRTSALPHQADIRGTPMSALGRKRRGGGATSRHRALFGHPDSPLHGGGALDLPSFISDVRSSL